MTDVEARLGQLAARFDVSAATLANAGRLLELWATDELASTRVTSPRDAVDQHLADSWVALDLPQIRAAQRIADLGTGAGVPALPLAIALPSVRLALVESVGRRTVFLERAIEECGLGERAEIVVARAEGWPAGIGAHDVVTSRALAPLDIVFEYSAPLLELGGVAVAWKGALSAEERAGGERAAELLGLELEADHRVEPFRGARERRLIVARKVAETPARFPRREGMAKKRPLGSQR